MDTDRETDRARAMARALAPGHGPLHARSACRVLRRMETPASAMHGLGQWCCEKRTGMSVIFKKSWQPQHVKNKGESAAKFNSYFFLAVALGGKTFWLAFGFLGSSSRLKSLTKRNLRCIWF